MHDIRSRLRRLLLLLVLVVSGTAVTPEEAAAAIPGTPSCTYVSPTVCFQYRNPRNAGHSWHATIEPACAQALATRQTTGWAHYSSVQISGGAYCYYYNAAGAYAGQDEASRQNVSTPSYSCPANSTLSGSSCSCNAPQWVQQGNVCVPGKSELEEFCEGLAAGLPQDYTVPGRGARTTCLMTQWGGGCVVNLEGPAVSVQIDGQWSTAGSGKYSGGTCQGNAPVPPETAQPPLPPASAPVGATNPCPNGQAGQVNGVQVCIPYPPNVPREATEGQSKETTNPDGTKSIEAKQQTATCTGNTCQVSTSTTTTTKDSAGNTTGTGTVTVVTNQPKAQFCVENPGSAQCKLDDDGGGECEQDPSRLACIQLGTPGQAEIPSNTVQIGTPGTYNMAGFNLSDAPVAGASWEVGCPAPLTFEILGRTFALSFEGFCRASQWIRYLVWLASALVALYIVYSAIVGARK